MGRDTHRLVTVEHPHGQVVGDKVDHVEGALVQPFRSQSDLHGAVDDALERKTSYTCVCVEFGGLLTERDCIPVVVDQSDQVIRVRVGVDEVQRIEIGHRTQLRTEDPV